MAPNQFWNSSALEPKRQHRWLVTFGSNISAELPSYIARSVDKPSFEINEAQHKYFGHTFKYPGQVTWNDVSMTLVDPVAPDATAALYKALGGFATNGVNLCKLESFSVKNTFDQVNFYIDIEGHIEDPSLQKALEELGFHTQKLDILGVYEAHPFRVKNK